MKNIPLLIGTLLITIVLIVGAAMFFSQPSTPKKVDSPTLLGDARHSKGPADAKVTVVEFSDLQCPACLAVEPTVRQLTATHPDIRLVYRQFPLVQIHHNAEQAAVAAEAAGELGKFWEMHDALFDHQSEWADVDSAAAAAKIESYAEKLQIDKNEFEKKIESQEVKDKVAQDVSDGTKANIQGTPTFFVNGQETPAQDLVSTVESLLKSTH